MPHAPPLTFLSLRYALSVLCFAGLDRAGAARPGRATRAQWVHLAVIGMLMHAGYLGGVWAAVKAGIGAGTVALMVGLQPVLTALWLSPAPRGASTTASRRGSGSASALGLGRADAGGVATSSASARSTPVNLGAGALRAAVSITVGTLYQKRMWSRRATCARASAVQLLAALRRHAAAGAARARARSCWHPQLSARWPGRCSALTLGGSSLLYLLIQRGAATRVTSLMYLVPPCTALAGLAAVRRALTRSRCDRHGVDGRRRLRWSCGPPRPRPRAVWRDRAQSASSRSLRSRSKQMRRDVRAACVCVRPPRSCMEIERIESASALDTVGARGCNRSDCQAWRQPHARPTHSAPHPNSS